VNKFAIYLALVMIFLTFAKSNLLTEDTRPLLRDSLSLAAMIPGKPVSAVLVDTYTRGLLIKTRYLKFRLVYSFKPAETKIFRAQRRFAKDNLKNLGMSLFNRDESGRQTLIPTPPGFMYVGESEYGHWSFLDSGARIWIFHSVYNHLYTDFAWGEYAPTDAEYEKARQYLEVGKPFYGSNNNFGIDGDVTRNGFPDYFEEKRKNSLSFDFNGLFETLFLFKRERPVQTQPRISP
jgi:hypothetical protein